MNFFERIIYFLQGEMIRPNPYGWFHLTCIFFTLLAIIILYLFRKKYNEKQLKTVLAVYGIIALVLEVIKQIIWSFNYDVGTGIVTWDYQWYAAPFQLCTTPIFISLICLFMEKNKIRDSLLSYMAFVTILGSIMTIILPDSCFVETALVNVHTMWLHCGSLVVSVYLLFTGEVEIKIKNLKNALYVFLIFVFIAEFLNISIYNSGILNGEDFNMFYISPYFITHLPVYNTVQQSAPFIIYLIFYMFSITLGATVIYFFAKLIQLMKNKIINKAM